MRAMSGNGVKDETNAREWREVRDLLDEPGLSRFAVYVLCFSCSSRFSRSSRILDASRAFLAFPANRARGCP